jgi:hypothetical protein
MAEYVINNLPSPIEFENVSGPVKRTLQNAKNLLMTQMGEVPYDRYRGFDSALYDLPLQELRERLLPECDRLMMWEPDAEVVDAECELNSDGRVIITLILEIDIDG